LLQKVASSWHLTEDSCFRGIDWTNPARSRFEAYQARGIVRVHAASSGTEQTLGRELHVRDPRLAPGRRG
jgi:hypothetical protein